jgi:hypothetical protein
MKTTTFLFILAVTTRAFSTPADSTKTTFFENKNKHPVHKFYSATGGELIFALGDQQADSLLFENKWRFSLFPHLQQQYHYNFSKAFGFYTGFSLINVGFRHNIQLPDSSSFELRQRSLSFGIPAALKIGGMENGNFMAIGCSAELMFRYKYKIYYNGEKDKHADWFSDKVNLFNPSVFIDFRNKTGGYIRFKYYLSNFLSTTSSSYLLPATTTGVTFTPSQSPLFYISIGSTFMQKKARKLTKDDV